MIYLLSTTYLGPIQYFTKFVAAEKIILEQFEHYPKQSYRNRCVIYGANGPLSLTVPVTKGNQLKIYTRDLRIDSSVNWQKIHLKAIESAYNNSPFYEYYIDEFLPILNKPYTFLYDMNFDLIKLLCRLITIDVPIEHTASYVYTPAKGIMDMRNEILPKAKQYKTDDQFKAAEYHQVFSLKHGFVKNLSIIDLLFNTGPDCRQHLISSII